METDPARDILEQGQNLTVYLPQHQLMEGKYIKAELASEAQVCEGTVGRLQGMMMPFEANMQAICEYLREDPYDQRVRFWWPRMGRMIRKAVWGIETPREDFQAILKQDDPRKIAVINLEPQVIKLKKGNSEACKRITFCQTERGLLRDLANQPVLLEINSSYPLTKGATTIAYRPQPFNNLTSFGFDITGRIHSIFHQQDQNTDPTFYSWWVDREQKAVIIGMSLVEDEMTLRGQGEHVYWRGQYYRFSPLEDGRLYRALPGTWKYSDQTIEQEIAAILATLPLKRIKDWSKSPKQEIKEAFEKLKE